MLFYMSNEKKLLLIQIIKFQMYSLKTCVEFNIARSVTRLHTLHAVLPSFMFFTIKLTNLKLVVNLQSSHSLVIVKNSFL